jgi:hypothetical protein
MTKFVITKNGNTITHIPGFTTREQAEQYISDIGGGYEVAEAFDATPVTLEHALTENARLKDELNAMKNKYEYVSGHLTSWSKRWNEMSEFIQESINNEEWSEGALETPFWEHLAEQFNLELQPMEEMEISVTVTYTGVLTVPKGTGYTDFEVDSPSILEVTLNNENVGELTWSEEEFDQF